VRTTEKGLADVTSAPSGAERVREAAGSGDDVHPREGSESRDRPTTMLVSNAY